MFYKKLYAYMKKLGLYLFILTLLTLTSFRVSAQKFEFIKVPELEKILKNPDNKLFVINFWATWCPPCVKEFPGFEEVSKDYDTSKVKFIMVSLDFPSDLEKQLIPFIENNNVTLEVALMTDLDYDKWIDKVDPLWHGEIPATLVFNNAKNLRYFHLGEVGEPELRKMIDRYL
jgi:thiol-disulfide isomerase/thioredoxin